MNVSQVNVNQVLSQMRDMRAQMPNLLEGVSPTDQGASKVGAVKGADNTGFGEMLSGAINQVRDTQSQAGQLAKAYSLGDESIDITQVMVSMQKSKVSFEAMTQVRNKLVTAYKDIMNMPV